MQKIRNYVIPYLIYLLMVYLSPSPFQAWLDRLFPGLEISSIDLRKPLLPIAIVAVLHYLLSDWRRKLNEPFYNRVNETISQRVASEFGSQYFEWQRVRPAFYHIIDGDKSLTYLSDRIKSNGLIWFGFADLRLAGMLTCLIWGFAALTCYLLNLQNIESWMMSAVVSLTLVAVSALGSEITTRRHIQLIEEQLDQMFPLHKAALLAALDRGRT